MRLVEDLAEDIDGPKLRKGGHMQRIVEIELLEDALTTNPVEPEQAHIAVADTQEGWKETCLFRRQEIRMWREGGGKSGILQVEPVGR